MLGSDERKESDVSDSGYAYIKKLGEAYIIMFVVAAVVVAFNMLVATMNHTYENIMVSIYISHLKRFRARNKRFWLTCKATCTALTLKWLPVRMVLVWVGNIRFWLTARTRHAVTLKWLSVSSSYSLRTRCYGIWIGLQYDYTYLSYRFPLIRKPHSKANPILAKSFLSSNLFVVGFFCILYFLHSLSPGTPSKIIFL